jgi:hypothetical protein
MPTRYHEHYTELDAMGGALAKEHGVPYPIHPDLVRDERDPIRVGGEEIHQQALEWRRKLIRELEQRPDWVAAWRAEQDLNRRIEELCGAKGLTFMPHETPPWWASDDPEDQSLPAKLRRKLIAELEAA